MCVSPSCFPKLSHSCLGAQSYLQSLSDFRMEAVAFLSNHEDNSVVYTPVFLEALGVEPQTRCGSTQWWCVLAHTPFPFVSANPFLSSPCVSVLRFCLRFFDLFMCSLPICTLCIFFSVNAYHQKVTDYVACGFLRMRGFVEIDLMLSELSNTLQGEVACYSNR